MVTKRASACFASAGKDHLVVRMAMQFLIKEPPYGAVVKFGGLIAVSGGTQVLPHDALMGISVSQLHPDLGLRGTDLPPDIAG